MCTRQSCPVYTHLSQGLEPPILTAAPPRYFPGCFPLAFLEGHCSSSSPAVISLHLDPATWDPSAPSNRAASSSSTLSWSRWRYSTVLFFLSSSSATFCLSASFLALASASLLAFWAACSAQWASAASCSRRRDFCYISCHCFSRTSTLFYKISERVGEDIMNDTETRAKNFFFCLCIVDLGTITGFSDKPNRTSNKLNRTSKAQS